MSTGDPDWTEADLPFGETPEEIFGTLLYSPLDGCDFEDTVAILTQVQPDNYNVTYVDGPLTLEKAVLSLQVSGTSYIQRGDYAPDDFEINVNGLVCNDEIPEITTFRVEDGSGTSTSGKLDSGVYQVFAVTEAVPGLENYEVEQVPGELFVNPKVGCRNRIKAIDLCRSPASLADDPRVTTKLTFTYRNELDVPIYVPRGHDNYLFGPAYRSGELPEVFLPGTHTFEIYTDGQGLKWIIESPECWFPSISNWATWAPECATNLSSEVVDVDSFTPDFDDDIPQAYPNPATDYLTLYVGNLEGVVDIAVFDEAGRQLMRREFSADGQDEVYLDVSVLKPGILTIRRENQGEVSVFRIIKN